MSVHLPSSLSLLILSAVALCGCTREISEVKRSITTEEIQGSNFQDSARLEGLTPSGNTHSLTQESPSVEITPQHDPEVADSILDELDLVLLELEASLDAETEWEFELP
jgi:hypothetical protein